MTAVPTVLLGDPAHFYIRSGSNPHTRNRWGLRKKVNRDRAVFQWHAFARTLTKLGVRVLVLPSSEENPGSVFPANAGFLYPKDRFGSSARFYLSNLTPGRQKEKPLYESFLKNLGFSLAEVPYRFEGEADFIQTKEGFLFTSGPILRQRFVPHFGFPPYRRLYGFRSDARTLDFLKKEVGGNPVFPLTLTNEHFYHGDTLLASFGPHREYLLCYLPALSAESQRDLRALFRERLIPLKEADACHFAANGFQVEANGTFYFLCPEGLSESLVRAIAQRGVTPLPVDVSEFSGKGGGSVKCLLCDLGKIDPDSPHLTKEEKRFWEDRSYAALYPV